MRTLILLVLVMILSCTAFQTLAQSIPEDPCEAQLPKELRDVVLTKYEGFHLVKTSDYSAENIEIQKNYNNDAPCVGVASADVDGDGFQDLAFFLTRNDGVTMLMVARNISGKTWDISKLYDFPKEGPSRSYVQIIKPGTYEDIYEGEDAGGGAPEPGRVKKYKTKNAGFVAGTIEASGIAFFYTGKRWLHLWLSD